MLVFGDGALRQHNLGRGCRVLRVGWHPSWRLHLSARQIRNIRTQCKCWNWFWKTIKTQFKIYPLHWSDLWKPYPKLSMYNWDTAVCECTVDTKMCDGSAHKLIFAGALSLLQSLKRRVNGFHESLVTLWDMSSTFYSKWPLMQWTLPSSLWATKYKVCQYVERVWHLYSMLQESSELYSYFEIQKRI